jgi:hypothetical protein
VHLIAWALRKLDCVSSLRSLRKLDCVSSLRSLRKLDCISSLRSLRKLDCDDRRQWLPLIAGLEAYARAEGCAAMRIYGRRGWLKLLPDYRTSRVLLEKEL